MSLKREFPSGLLTIQRGSSKATSPHPAQGLTPAALSLRFQMRILLLFFAFVTLNHTVFCAACQLILRISFFSRTMIRFSRREI